MPLIEFKQKTVRDLVWALSSPPLVLQPSHACLWPEAKWFQQAYVDTLPWLQALDEDSSELDELLLKQKDKRLGKYFESLWLFWLTNNPRYQIVENNIQIIIDGETLGEIDFVIFDKKSQQTIHWEVAVKFYLGVGDVAKMFNWHGPNLRDRLDIKVEHLKNRQSMVAKDRRIASWLSMQGVDIDLCAVILKGRLYYPWQPESLVKRCLSSPFASEHLTSWWLTSSQFEQAFDEKEEFVPLINKGWMASIPTPDTGEKYNKTAINEIVSNEILHFPLHLQLANPHGSWDRLFVVDETWSK